MQYTVHSTKYTVQLNSYNYTYIVRAFHIKCTTKMSVSVIYLRLEYMCFGDSSNKVYMMYGRRSSAPEREEIKLVVMFSISHRL